MKTAVFLDMDGTVFRRESQLHFLIWSVRRGYTPRGKALALLGRYLLFQSGFIRDAHMLRESGFMLFRGMRTSDVETFIVEFLQSFQNHIRGGVYPLLEFHRQQGHRLVLVTAAMDRLANQVATLLMIEEVISTKLINERNIFTGSFEKPSPWGEGKLILAERYCLQKDIEPGRCYCYGDSYSDVPLMSYVGHPAAVHPDRKLKRIARERQWPILNWEQ